MKHFHLSVCKYFLSIHAMLNKFQGMPSLVTHLRFSSLMKVTLLYPTWCLSKDTLSGGQLTIVWGYSCAQMFTLMGKVPTKISYGYMSLTWVSICSQWGNVLSRGYKFCYNMSTRRTYLLLLKYTKLNIHTMSCLLSQSLR
jgi:hypothetical protein